MKVKKELESYKNFELHDKVEANSPFNDGWTREYYKNKLKNKVNINDVGGDDKEHLSQATKNFINNTRSNRSSMSNKVTIEELQEAFTEWNEKFKLVLDAYSGASIEECITILKAVEEAAKEKKEDEKPSMGFDA